MNDRPDDLPPLLQQPAKMVRRRRRKNRLGIAVSSGVVAALIGSLLWAILVGFVGIRLRFVAIGIGALTGYAVRFHGRGSSELFGLIAMLCAGFGCILGDLVGGTIVMAYAYHIPWLRVLDRITLDVAREIMFNTFTFLDFIFYFIAMCFAYRFAVLEDDA